MKKKGIISLLIAVVIILTPTGVLASEYVESTSTQSEYLDVSYIEGAIDIDPYQTMDIYLPQTDNDSKPVVVFIHGGAWVRGDKTDAELASARNAALEQGYATVAINHRLAQNHPWPAQINDCKAAIRYLRANAEKYGIDPDQIAVWGASAGGHLAQMMGVTNGMSDFEDLSQGYADYSSDVQAVVSFYGITNVSTWDCSSLMGLMQSMGLDKDPITILLGDDYSEEDALKASPIYYANNLTIPILLCHGQSDALVPFEQAQTMEAELLKYLDPELIATYYPEDAGHASAFWREEEPSGVGTAFLDKWLPVESKPDDNVRPDYMRVDIAEYANIRTDLYYANDTDEQKLHIVYPNDVRDEYPLIVFVHGGGFRFGNSSGTEVLYTAEGALHAVDSGYAVALVDYRTSIADRYPNQVYDVKAAIRYLRANAKSLNLNTEHIILWGESAGGYIVDYVGLTNGNLDYEDLSMGHPNFSSEVQAVISYYAITDLTAETNSQYLPSLGLDDADDELLWEASPLSKVTESAPYFYLQHGTGDSEVHFTDSEKLYEALTAATDTELHRLDLFPGYEHAVKKFISQDNVQSILEWLDTLPQDSSGFKLSTDAYHVKQDEYANISTEFVEGVMSNTAILNYTFNTDLFEYADFHEATGVQVISKEATNTGAKIVVMIPNYNTQTYGQLTIHAKSDAVLTRGWATVKADAEYVVRDENGTKEIRTASTTTAFTTVGPWIEGDTNVDGIIDIIDLSNMIDWFGIDSANSEWNSWYTYFDFDNNGNIDIYDIAFVARLIK